MDLTKTHMKALVYMIAIIILTEGCKKFKTPSPQTLTTLTILDHSKENRNLNDTLTDVLGCGCDANELSDISTVREKILKLNDSDYVKIGIVRTAGNGLLGGADHFHYLSHSYQYPNNM